MLSAADECQHGKSGQLHSLRSPILQVGRSAPRSHPRFLFSGDSRALVHLLEVLLRPDALRLLQVLVQDLRAGDAALFPPHCQPSLHSLAPSAVPGPTLLMYCALHSLAALHACLQAVQVACLEPSIGVQLLSLRQSVVLSGVHHLLLH